MEPAPSSSFLARHEFLIRRLHSLCGLVPVGAYMVVHLLTNATVLDGAVKFQGAVYQIHGLGKALLVVEWAFIFLPLLFHAIFGVVIIYGCVPNTSSYPNRSNVRYVLQRVTGMIAFVFIFWHVFHMHGWFHFEPWLSTVKDLGGAKFKPYNAASSGAAAMQTSLVIPILYTVGVLSCVYHLANGIGTMGITWGIWTSPTSQRRANIVCAVGGLALAAVSLGAIGGFSTTDVDKARQVEDTFIDSKIRSGELPDDEITKHKRTHDEHEKKSATRGSE